MNQAGLPGGFEQELWLTPISETRPTQGGIVARTDALVCLRSLASETASIVFLDPPFNIGKRYGARARGADRLPDGEYDRFLRAVLEEACRVLQPGGALYLYHLPKAAIKAATWLDGVLELRHWIAISMKNGYPKGTGLYPAHYALLYLTKGEPSHFERPKIPALTCPKCGGLVRSYGGYLKYVQDGVNLSDVWDDVSPVRHARHKHRSANELPPIIPQRVLAMSGVRGGLFVDPFGGSGTAALLARSAGMNVVVSDIDQSNVDLIFERLTA